ncbi:MULTISPECIES: GNAT family protein [Stenotrophomonas]|jgi:RimJ/RimL family protein N-acetyltransferase|uniref:GNAT family N-acetyltransferase n=1 Tax=Stenotrophomonas TaxID=40323 RepID=UPI0007035DE3|nr:MULTISPECIES: GNAT family protein [Stenotrophomonas]OZB52359.1 MAG: N-acetyltransferase [Stenotrophomonas sp. 14-69-23]KRG83214.1 acetyltransferase [Stenotrophomonas acidaminiphila]MCA7024599.1 GNAT family N-acetyltransferase [Stenotrophomonas acidaminiphila]MCE4073906.1 GNAT family N-acetyltransferase [Stenotrophomonas acidaminiphila]QOG00169.1 GNAT family N-acetyltransferase [Stenotrophomonas sp. CW117]
MTRSAADACWSTVPELRGTHVALEPLSMAHVPALRRALGEGELSRLWYANVPAPDAVERYVVAALEAQAQGSALPFVVADSAGEVVGCTRYYALDAGVPRLNIGYTWYQRRVQRTGLNTEAKLLLLRHAFEAMGCIGVGFETSWFNQASRAAIARLGARQDGVLRNHRRHADGTPRDTVVFSIIDSEWPAVRRHLQSLLDSHS